MRRKILVGIMSVAIWFNSAFCSMQVKAESETIINSNEAAYLAGMHVKSIISNEKNNSEWDWGVRLSEPIPMTDFLGNTSSYYFGVFDENDSSQGYVVVGATINVAPIVEYATLGSFYPYEMMEKIGADNIIYNGGYEYYLRKGEEWYDVSGFGEMTEIEDIDTVLEAGFCKEEHLEEWREILDHFIGGSNPPTSGYITSPHDYEDGYQSTSSKYIMYFTNNYKTQYSFPNYSNACSPIAATNVMLYWYNRDSSTYGSLRRYGDSTWGATFLRLYQLMGTTSGGTNYTNIAPAYNTYFEEADIPMTATLYFDPTWNQIKTALNAEKPIHVIVQGHVAYGNHSLVGLGYICFNYSGGFSSNYIRVADGRISSPSRYVHYSVGNNALRMVRFS